LELRVELPREERAGRQQDLVGPVEFAVFPLEFFDPCRVATGSARFLAGVDPPLLGPAAQRVGHDPDPRADPLHRRVQRQRWIFLHRLVDQPQRTLTQLVGVFPGSRH